MPLFEITESGLNRHEPSSFASLEVRERDDLQRLLRDEISVLDENLLVVSEEYGQWEDARRRIDLLALDKDGHLVVIELKRTEAGGHMDLQALRYAAMVSSMVFDDVVAAYASFLEATRPGEDRDPRAEICSFLDRDEGEEIDISSDVRIVLVSRDFGREITTAVLWLNRFEGMDIRCFRFVPYGIEDKVLLDVQQIVPLPEAADYQVKVRRKDQERERGTRVGGRDFTRFEIVVDGEPQPPQNKRNAARNMVAQLIERGCPADRIAEIIGPRRFRGADGEFTDTDELISSVSAAYPKLSFNPGRWFLEQPFRHNGRTWVVSKMWGRSTEELLKELSEAFPDAGVSFRRADSD